MSAITEAATVEQSRLPDQIADMIHVGWGFVPTILVVASSPDVMVGAGDVTTARITFVDAGIYLVTVLLQQGIEFLELAGIGRMNRDVEAIGRLHRHHDAIAIGINGLVRAVSRADALCLARCRRDRVESRAATIIVT